MPGGIFRCTGACYSLLRSRASYKTTKLTLRLAEHFVPGKKLTKRNRSGISQKDFLLKNRLKNFRSISLFKYPIADNLKIWTDRVDFCMNAHVSILFMKLEKTSI